MNYIKWITAVTVLVEVIIIVEKIKLVIYNSRFKMWENEWVDFYFRTTLFDHLIKSDKKTPNNLI